MPRVRRDVLHDEIKFTYIGKFVACDQLNVSNNQSTKHTSQVIFFHDFSFKKTKSPKIKAEYNVTELLNSVSFDKHFHAHAIRSRYIKLDIAMNILV